MLRGEGQKYIGNNRLLRISYVLFLCGFAYYCVLPVVFLRFLPDYPISALASRSGTGDDFAKLFSGLAMTYFALFLIGFRSVSQYTAVCKQSMPSKRASPRLGIAIVGLYYLVAVFNISPGEILHPAGYLDGYDIVHRGQLTTLYLTAVWWFIFFERGIYARSMFIVICLSAANLLSLGSRLGVITGLIALVLYWAMFMQPSSTGRNPLRKMGSIKWVLLGFGIALSMAAIGILREGGGLNWEGILSIFIAESIFIYSSVPAYLSYMPISIVAFPTEIFASMLGAIPTFLWPSKLEFLNAYTSVPIEASSGFGGLNHIIAILANFGLAGFPFAAFLEGAWFAYLAKRAQSSAFFRASALCTIALIPFILFREGMQTTIKLVFFNFLLYPFFLTKLALYCKISVNRSQAPQRDTSAGQAGTQD